MQDRPTRYAKNQQRDASIQHARDGRGRRDHGNPHHARDLSHLWSENELLNFPVNTIESK